MQECPKLMRGPNSAMRGNTVGRGRSLRTHRASCGARLRPSTTNDGAANTTGRGTTAAALPVRLNPCGSSAVCWNTRQKPALGLRMDWPRLPGLAGNGASMAAGCAKCGRAHTGIEPRKLHGFITPGRTRRLKCDGIGQPERTRLDSTTSAARQQTSRHSESAKRTRRQSSFETRLLHWHDTRRECPSR